MQLFENIFAIINYFVLVQGKEAFSSKNKTNIDENMLNQTFIGIEISLKGNYYKRHQKLH